MIKRDSLVGVLFIGDPHIEGKAPDFRCDDFPNVILEKVQWCLDYAGKNRLLPVFLGDLFDKPRNNPTWVIGRLIEMLIGSNAIGIYGNHDCAEPVLSENDSLMLLVKAGCLRLVSQSSPWTGFVAGRPVLIGGSSYRERIPKAIAGTEFPRDGLFPEPTFGIWITHHDIKVQGYESGRFSPFEIENIDVLVNGHIHTRGKDIRRGQTRWINPGNISRRSRSEKCRTQKPAVLQITLTEESYLQEYVTVPHQSFDDVFHAPVHDNDTVDNASAFVAGLNE
ncbi:MAG: metallophosphoesterase, partial [Planctomycetota bacterium]